MLYFRHNAPGSLPPVEQVEQGRRVREGGQYQVAAGLLELRHRVTPGGDTDRDAAVGVGTHDIARRVADDEGALGVDRLARVFKGALHRDARQVVARLAVLGIAGDRETIHLKPGGDEFHPRGLLVVARQDAQHQIAVLHRTIVERIDQRRDAGHQHDVVADPAKLRLKLGQVSRAELREVVGAVVDAVVLGELREDLRVECADGDIGPRELFAKDHFPRASEAPAARAFGNHQRAIDIKKQQRSRQMCIPSA